MDVLVVREGRVDFKLGIIFPLVGITDFHGEAEQFLDGFELGLVAHPGEVDDVLAEGLAEVAHKLEHLLFGAFGEEFLHIELSDGLAHVAVGCAEGAFPAGTHLFYSAHYLAELK